MYVLYQVFEGGAMPITVIRGKPSDIQEFRELCRRESQDKDVMNATLIRIFERIRGELKVYLAMGDECIRMIATADHEDLKRLVEELKERRGHELFAEYDEYVRTHDDL